MISIIMISNIVAIVVAIVGSRCVAISFTFIMITCNVIKVILIIITSWCNGHVFFILIIIHPQPWLLLRLLPWRLLSWWMLKLRLLALLLLLLLLTIIINIAIITIGTVSVFIINICMVITGVVTISIGIGTAIFKHFIIHGR